MSSCIKGGTGLCGDILRFMVSPLSELWCPPSQNCGVLSEPPVKPQVRRGRQHPTEATWRFTSNLLAT